MSYETGYYGKLGQLSEVDKRIYAKKHNYTLIVNNKILDKSRKPSWFKSVNGAGAFSTLRLVSLH